MKIYIALMILSLFTSCATQLSKEGENVKLVTDSQKEKYCEMIEILTTSSSIGWSSAGDLDNAMNEARNMVARAGGNAMKVISSNIASYKSSSEAIVQVEALLCNLPKNK